MKHLLCAAALSALAASPANATVHTLEYTMQITAINIAGEGFVQSAQLPIGNVSVGDVGSGSFGYSDSWNDAHNIGYSNWGYGLSETYMIGSAPTHRFNVGTISHEESMDNSYSLSDSYDARRESDNVTFQAWHDSANILQIGFYDTTASHLHGTERTDVGTFPVEHYGVFWFTVNPSVGTSYMLQGVLLTAGMDGGPMVNLPPLGPTPDPLPVPEPATYLMLGAGLGLMGWRRRRTGGAGGR